MQKRKKQKLTLNLETLRQLTVEEVRPADGGCLPTTTTAYVTCFCTKLQGC